MTTIGTVESLWRYPVKSMAGERLPNAFAGFSGIYGDRCYAFRNSAARRGFPYLNANVQPKMLMYRPQFRYPERASVPPNIAESMRIGSGVTHANRMAADMVMDVTTPDGSEVALDDLALLMQLGEGLRGENNLTLVQSDRALTDCRPISVISMQTIRQLELEMGIPLDCRRFRANIYFDLHSDKGFGEDELIGRRIRIGDSAEIMILERDSRCPMISLDPDTGEPNPDILRKVAQSHGNNAGVYCAILVEGMLTTGDCVNLLD